MGDCSVVKAFNEIKQILGIGVDKNLEEKKYCSTCRYQGADGASTTGSVCNNCRSTANAMGWVKKESLRDSDWSCVTCKHSDSPGFNHGDTPAVCVICLNSIEHSCYEKAEPDSDKTSPTVPLAKHIAEEAKNPVSEKELAAVMNRLERSNASRVSRSQLHVSIAKSCEAIPKLFDYKNADYGQQNDAFANFRKTAERIVQPFMQRHGITIGIDEAMFLVMQVLQDKHLVALSQTGLSGNEVAERLGDVANYALIQKALYEAVDRGNNDDE